MSPVDCVYAREQVPVQGEVLKKKKKKSGFTTVLTTKLAKLLKAIIITSTLLLPIFSGQRSRSAGQNLKATPILLPLSRQYLVAHVGSEQFFSSKGRRYVADATTEGRRNGS